MKIYVFVAGKLGEMDYKLIEAVEGIELLPDYSEYDSKWDETEIVVKAESIDFVKDELEKLGAKISEIGEY